MATTTKKARAPAKVRGRSAPAAEVFPKKSTKKASKKSAKKAAKKTVKKAAPKPAKPSKSSKKKDEQEIKLLAMDIRRVEIPIVSITSLITSNWSEKSLRMIRDTQQKRAQTAKDPKDPEADFQAAKYHMPDGRDAVPAISFKSAIVSAARFNDAKMTVLRGAIFVGGVDGTDFLPIEYEECVMREDPVRVGMGKTDLRYRPEYRNWRVVLPIEYNASVLTIEQVVNLVRLAGFSVGVCEWRPEKNGQFGRFDVDPDALNLTESL